MNTLSLKCIRLRIAVFFLACGLLSIPAAGDGWQKDDVLGWCYPATGEASTWTLFLGMGWYYHIPGENGDWLWSSPDRWCYTNCDVYPWFWLEVKDLWRRLDYDAYFQNLQPDVTMETILKEFGEDDADIENKLVYATNSGEYELTFADGNLYWAELIYPVIGKWQFYREFGTDTAATILERDQWVATGNFKVLPDWKGHKSIYSPAYPGKMYPLSEGYAQVESIIHLMGGIGYMADKVAMVSVIRDGQEEILYRAYDVWETLNDSHTLDEAQASQAAIIAKFKNGEEVLDDGSTPLLWVGFSGSGVLYSHYYIPAGLVTVNWDKGFDSASLYKPGYPGWENLKEWALAQ